MEPFFDTLFRCGAQVTLVAMFGLAALWIANRLRPGLAPALACSIMVAIVFVSVAAPFHLPTMWPAIHDSAADLKPASDELSAVQSVSSLVASDSPVATGSFFTVEWQWMVDRMETLASHGSTTALNSSFGDYLLPVVLLFALLGSLRLFLAINYSRTICRHSRPISDSRVIDIANSLMVQLCPGRSVQIRQTDQISTAAVIGWLRPTILLPREYGGWSLTETRSVLAHELAHVARHDAVWRALSCLVTTTHYYNPFVHLLMRRMALTQEIVADLLAAQVVGRREYVRALSSLALKRDEGDAYFSQAGLHPVFSGYLIRRIKMLKTRTDSGNATGIATSKLAGVLMIVAVGAVAFAAKGLTQTTKVGEASGSTVTRVARVDPARKVEKSDPTIGLFQRRTIDPDLIPENNFGMIGLQVADFLKRSDTTAMAMMFNRSLAEVLKNIFGGPELRDFDLDSVDVFFGATSLLGRYRPEADGPRKFQMFHGSGCSQVQFRYPVNLSQWIERYVPSAEQSQQHELTVYTLPVIPVLGPVPLAVASRNPNTVCFSSTFTGVSVYKDGPTLLASLHEMVTHREQPNTSQWANAFRRVSGGLLTYAVTSDEIRWPEKKYFSNADDKNVRIFNEAFHRISHTFDTLAVGADLSEDGNRGGVRIRIGSRNRTDTDKILADVRQLHRMGLLLLRNAESTSESSTPDTFEEFRLEFFKQFLEKMVIDVEEHSDGSSDVYIQSALSYPSFVGLVFCGFADSDNNKPQE